MEGFVSVVFCITCDIQTDRNGLCLACGKTITAYRVRESGKMRLIFTDGTRARYLTDVRCQRCGCSEIRDSFEAAGTCWNCAVHNTIKNRVLGQWRFLQYQVTLAPANMPVKNVIKEIDLEMAKKFVYRGGIGRWIEDDESRYQTAEYSAILEKIRDEGLVSSNSMKAHLHARGERVHIGLVTCLFCGKHQLRIDKFCQACGTSNEMVIRRDESGQMAVINVSREVSTGKELTKEMKLLGCPWDNYHPITNSDLSCSQCNLILDVAETQHLTVDKSDGVVREMYGHNVSLHPHAGKRPENALRIVCVRAPQKPPVPAVSYPPITSSAARHKTPTRETISATDIQQRPRSSVEYPLVHVDTSKNKSDVFTKLRRFFERSTPKQRSAKPPSARTVRRHTKAARDAAYKREQHVACRLADQGYSERKIAEMMSDKFGNKITKSKVRRLLKKD